MPGSFLSGRRQAHITVSVDHLLTQGCARIALRNREFEVRVRVLVQISQVISRDLRCCPLRYLSWYCEQW